MTTLLVFLLLSLTHMGAMVVGHYLLGGLAEKKPKRRNKYHY